MQPKHNCVSGALLSFLLLAMAAVGCYACVILGISRIEPPTDPLYASYTYQNRTQPVWSPDGKKILFTPMIVANADGSEALDLQIGRGHGGDFSPDGNFIVYANYRDGMPSIFNSDKNNISIETVAVDGSESRRLTKPRSRHYGINPTWAPDGRAIAFVGGPSIVTPDGSGLQHLLNPDTYQSRQRPIGDSVVWSPDGHRIAYIGERGDIYVIELVDLNLTRLTAYSDREYDSQAPLLTISQPAWAPDGATIAFASMASLEGPVVINTVGVDGAGLRELASLPLSIGFFTKPPRWVGFKSSILARSPIKTLAWAPDGSEIFTESNPMLRIKTDGSAISLMRLPGLPPGVAVTENLVDVAWSPDRTRIAYDYRREDDKVFFTTAADGSDKRLIHQEGTLPGWWYTELEWEVFRSEGR